MTNKGKDENSIVVIDNDGNETAISPSPIKYIRDKPVYHISHYKEPIWERQTELGENPKDYAAFLCYSQIHPSKRTIGQAWRNWSKKDTGGMSGNFKSKSMIYHWDERAAAWDIEKINDSKQDWIMRDETRRDGDYEIGALLKEIARGRLTSIVDGEEHISPGIAARFAELGSKLQGDAIPNISLEQDEITGLFKALSEQRRESIVAILLAKFQ